MGVEGVERVGAGLRAEKSEGLRGVEVLEDAPVVVGDGQRVPGGAEEVVGDSRVAEVVRHGCKEERGEAPGLQGGQGRLAALRVHHGEVTRVEHVRGVGAVVEGVAREVGLVHGAREEHEPRGVHLQALGEAVALEHRGGDHADGVHAGQVGGEREQGDLRICVPYPLLPARQRDRCAVRQTKQRVALGKRGAPARRVPSRGCGSSGTGISTERHGITRLEPSAFPAAAAVFGGRAHVLVAVAEGALDGIHHIP
mmetsp:Transcript_2887/g.9452  ORF Transcript_2887/g.9452 Transcript_2887/m.9452 type:complete len:254 (-) Transcript_2887:515-1276(-)